MALSYRHEVAFGEAASWLAASALVALGLIYYDDLRSHVASGLGIASTGGDAVRPLLPRRLPSNQRPAGSVELSARTDGHYYAKAEINGRAANVM